MIDGSSGTWILWKKTGEADMNNMNNDLGLYCHACKISVKHFSWLAGDLDDFRKESEKTVSKEFLDAINFSGFELEPWETHILSYTSGLLLFLLMSILDLILFRVFTYERNTIIFAVAFTVIIPVAVMIYISKLIKRMITL